MIVIIITNTYLHLQEGITNTVKEDQQSKTEEELGTQSYFCNSLIINKSKDIVTRKCDYYCCYYICYSYC